jgi:hypothetical protein
MRSLSGCRWELPKIKGEPCLTRSEWYRNLCSKAPGRSRTAYATPLHVEKPTLDRIPASPGGLGGALKPASFILVYSCRLYNVRKIVWRTGYLPTIVFTFSAMQTHSRLLRTPHASLELHPKFDTWESIWSAQDVVRYGLSHAIVPPGERRHAYHHC